MAGRFSIFGIGKDGIPSFFRRWFANGGDMAVDTHIVRTADQSDDAKTVSLVLDEWHGDGRLEARAMASGLISPDTMLPLPSAGVRKWLGFPPRLNKFREFAEVAGRDAIALAYTARRDHPELVDALSDLVARVREGRWVLSVNALAEATTQSWIVTEGDTLQSVQPAARRDKTRDGVGRAAIAGGKLKQNGKAEVGWRGYPEYRHMVTEVGGHLAIKLADRSDLTDKAIREIALKAPVGWVLELVGEVPTVWSTIRSSDE